MKHLLTFLLCLPFFLFAQTRYDRFDGLIQTADSLRTASNWGASLDHYKKAFEVVTPNSPFYHFRAAECAFQLGLDQQADELIRAGFIKSGGFKAQFTKFKGFKPFENGAVYKGILKDYNALRQQHFAQMEHIDIYLEIEQLKERDQVPRKVPDYLSGRTEAEIDAAHNGYQKAKAANDTVAMKKFKALMFPERDPAHQEIMFQLMRPIDSLNVVRLIEITEEYGWQHNAWLILWHQRGTYGEDYWVWNYFKPYIDQEIEAGNISRKFWDMFEGFQVHIAAPKKE